MSFNILALSDVHLRSTTPVARKDNFLKTQFRKLKFIFDYANERNAVILQAGDFLDKSRDWNLLTLLIKFFRSYPRVKFYCVQGQHDNYYYSSTRSTTLGILERTGYIKILSPDTSKLIQGWNIWGSSWEEKLPDKLSLGDYNILVTHRSISPTQVYPGQKYDYPQTFLFDNYKYQIIIVGDIHQSFFKSTNKDNRVILNTGPMLRAEANSYNMDHHSPHFYHLKLLRHKVLACQKIKIPHEDSYEVLSRSHIPDKSNDVAIDELATLIENTSISDLNKNIFKKIFADKSIRPNIRKIMKEIYDNAQR